MSASRIPPQPLTRPLAAPSTATPSPTEAPGANAPPAPWVAGAPTARTAPGQLAPQQAVVCPVLGALVAENKLPMAADGTVKVADLNKALAEIGMSKGFQAGARPTAWGANPAQEIFGNIKGDAFNVLDLRGGFIKHPGDSAILTKGAFDEQKFDALVSHADHGVMTESAFGKAIAANTQRDTHGLLQTLDSDTRGKQFSQLEFGALLSAFGTRDPQTGQLGISVEELRNLYEHKRLPAHASGHGSIVNATALAASLELKADAALASNAFGSFMTATGLSTRGAQLAQGKGEEAPMATQASVSAGKAASCPHLNGGQKLPSAAQTINAHTPAGS